ncbi:MAG: putative sulfate/molybdate transporter [Anaerolineales bacterium]
MERDTTQYPDFEFNMRELGGSMGDFGTLFPLAVGLIAVSRLDPTALFVMMGLANILLGLVYRLPMPLEPKKVIAVTAIAQGWPAAMVTASALGLGVLWLLLVMTGLVSKLVEKIPTYLIRGIQLALGISLGMSAVEMMLPELWLGALAIVIILLLRENRYAPAAVVIMGLGVAIMLLRGELSQGLDFGIGLPRFSVPKWSDIWQAMVQAGFAQIPLSITNAVLATATLIRDLFPEKPVTERKLLFNMGVMNVVSSLFGGMPMCHGAHGLAGQYYFGARTGGASILEGLIEIILGIFLGRALLAILTAFPMPLIGGMMLMVGIRLAKVATELRRWPLYLALLTAAISVALNMAVGFIVGLAAAYTVRWLIRRGTIQGDLQEV